MPVPAPPRPRPTGAADSCPQSREGHGGLGESDLPRSNWGSVATARLESGSKNKALGGGDPPRRHRPGATPLLPPQAPCHPQIPSESVAPLWPLPSLTPSVAPHTTTGKGTQEPGRPAVHPWGLFRDPTPGASHVPHFSQPERRPAGPRGPEGPELFSPGAGSKLDTDQHFPRPQPKA